MEYPIEIKGKTIKQVKKINLSHKNLKRIPDNVYSYTNLEKLDLSYNRISSIPCDILKLRKLRTLDLSFNQLKVLQGAIFRLPKLRILNFHGNQISKVPKQIASSNIETLILSKNKVEELDENLIEKLKKIDLTDNPISTNKEGVINELMKTEQLSINSNVLSANLEQTQQLQYNKYKIFISYSHKNKEYLDRLLVHLKVLKNLDGGFEVWSDEKIKTGQKWKEEIKNALAISNIAILLISTDFLASDFVTNNELPPILEKAKSANTKVLSLLVEPSRFADSSLSEFQAVNDPSLTLAEMSSRAEQDRVYLKLMDEIQNIISEKS